MAQNCEYAAKGTSQGAVAFPGTSTSTSTLRRGKTPEGIVYTVLAAAVVVLAVLAYLRFFG